MAALTLAATGPARSATYLEVFPFDPDAGLSQGEAYNEEGWFGGHEGDDFGTFIAENEGAISASSIGSTELSPANSNPTTNETPTAFAYFSKNGVSAGAFLYTTEFQFEGPDFTVSWESQNNVNTTNTQETDTARIEANDMHVAVRVRNDDGFTWFFSEQAYFHDASNSVWRQHSFDSEGASWFSSPTTDTGDVLTGPTSASAAVGLPEGTRDAIGIYVETSASTFRIDNFGVTPVPLPAAAWLLIAALGGLWSFARRRPA